MKYKKPIARDLSGISSAKGQLDFASCLSGSRVGDCYNGGEAGTCISSGFTVGTDPCPAGYVATDCNPTGTYAAP